MRIGQAYLRWQRVISACKEKKSCQRKAISAYKGKPYLQQWRAISTNNDIHISTDEELSLPTRRNYPADNDTLSLPTSSYSNIFDRGCYFATVSSNQHGSCNLSPIKLPLSHQRRRSKIIILKFKRKMREEKKRKVRDFIFLLN